MSPSHIDELEKAIMFDQESSTVTAEPIVRTSKQKKKTPPKRQPRYHVILWDDDDHSYEYVILMMRQLFGHSFEKGYQIAKIVDSAGRSICLTTTKEHAELKRDQIHGFGKDFLMEGCAGAMSASIEPENSE